MPSSSQGIAAPIRHAVCGSPEYFRKHGKPKVPADLEDHKALLYSYVEPRQAWQFTGSDPVLMPSDFSCNNGDVLREMAAAGCGLAFLPTFIIYRAVEEGRLETCLTEYARETIGFYSFGRESIGEGAGMHRPRCIKGAASMRDWYWSWRLCGYTQ